MRALLLAALLCGGLAACDTKDVHVDDVGSSSGIDAGFDNPPPPLVFDAATFPDFLDAQPRDTGLPDPADTGTLDAGFADFGTVEACAPIGDDVAFTFHVESEQVSGGRAGFSGIATATVAGDVVTFVFEADGYRLAARVSGDAAARLPIGERWQTTVTIDQNPFSPLDTLVLRHIDGPRAGGLRFALWHGVYGFGDIDSAPLEIWYTRSPCETFRNDCVVEGAMSLHVRAPTQTVDVDVGRSVQVGDMLIANGDSRYALAGRCDDRVATAQSFIDVR